MTLSGTVLSAQCPFCDSAHVLVQDAVGSFEEPDALLPFKLDRRAAGQAVHNRLAPELRAQVERGDLVGVYLPFWAFEGLVSILMPLTATVLDALRPGAYPAHDVLVSGVAQPREAILAEVMPYDLHELVRYDHRYLAQWPAQIYSVDVIEASITGRAYIKYAARQQATGYPVPENRTGAQQRPLCAAGQPGVAGGAGRSRGLELPAAAAPGVVDHAGARRWPRVCPLS